MVITGHVRQHVIPRTSDSAFNRTRKHFLMTLAVPLLATPSALTQLTVIISKYILSPKWRYILLPLLLIITVTSGKIILLQISFDITETQL
jgi:small neutral amino acid transporter SnatA (MarC family)